MSDFERHDMPNGQTVYYRDSDHSYWSQIQEKSAGNFTGIKDCRLAGISTVVSPLDYKPDNLMRWACRQELDGVSILAAEGLSLEEPDDMRCALEFLHSGDSIAMALMDARLRHTDRRDEAATRGTNVHLHALQALAMGKPVPSYGEMTDEEKGYAAGIVAFWLDHNPTTLQCEQVVYDRELRVAGRFDLRCQVGAEVWLVDAKTGSSTFTPAKHHAQLAGYDYCAISSGFGSSHRRFILKVTPEGTYTLIESAATWADFIISVQTYRAAARIGTDARAALKAA